MFWNICHPSGEAAQESQPSHRGLPVVGRAVEIDAQQRRRLLRRLGAGQRREIGVGGVGFDAGVVDNVQSHAGVVVIQSRAGVVVIVQSDAVGGSGRRRQEQPQEEAARRSQRRSRRPAQRRFGRRAQGEMPWNSSLFLRSSSQGFPIWWVVTPTRVVSSHRPRVVSPKRFTWNMTWN